MLTKRPTAVFVLGASGMLGNAMLRVLGADARYDVQGVVRNAKLAKSCMPACAPRTVGGFDAYCPATLEPILADSEAPVLVNCVGVVKQLDDGNRVLTAAPINSLLPHRLVEIAERRGGRVVHFSTDCVFSGDRGGYAETDAADARDIYGLTKLLGEVQGPSAVTLRTSIIGHGLAPNGSLVDWFLSQKTPVRGFRRAIFSGLPTVVLARIVRDHVLPAEYLKGLYHVSAAPIDKFTLLSLINDTYGANIALERHDDFSIDRSLDSTRFREATGWQPESWPQLIAEMHRDFIKDIDRGH